MHEFKNLCNKFFGSFQIATLKAIESIYSIYPIERRPWKTFVWKNKNIVMYHPRIQAVIE